MVLCFYNPQLLNQEWSLELVQRLGGKVGSGGYTALIWLFIGSASKTDFCTSGFKMLWEREKDININHLKEWMQKKPKLQTPITVAVPDAVIYY